MNIGTAFREPGGIYKSGIVQEWRLQQRYQQHLLYQTKPVVWLLISHAAKTGAFWRYSRPRRGNLRISHSAPFHGQAHSAH